MTERPRKVIWCVFAVMRAGGALTYLGELHCESGTYSLQLKKHAEAIPGDTQRPYWIASRRRMLATFAEAGIRALPPASMTFHAKPAGSAPERLPLALLGHVINSETILLAHQTDVRVITRADYVIGHERSAACAIPQTTP